MPEPFKAHVQYDDFYGTAAVDNLDMDQIESRLVKAGLMSDGEKLVGIELYGTSKPGLKFLVMESASHGTTRTAFDAADPVRVRVVEIEEISFDQFFALFKRFALTLVPKHLDPTGREFVEISRSGPHPASVL